MERHAQESSEFRDKGPQHTAAVHLQKSLVNSVFPLENLEKRQVGGGRATVTLIDQTQILAQQLPRFLTYFYLMLLDFCENANQISRVQSQNRWI
jgi:hypothetical protein